MPVIGPVETAYELVKGSSSTPAGDEPREIPTQNSFDILAEKKVLISPQKLIPVNKTDYIF